MTDEQHDQNVIYLFEVIQLILSSLVSISIVLYTMTTSSRDQSHKNWKHVILRYHPVKFGPYRYGQSEDITFLNCLVTPCDQKGKKSSDMTIGNMSSLRIILSSLVPIGIVKVEI